jgi:hypothetical protein
LSRKKAVQADRPSANGDPASNQRPVVAD